jgi:CubicO group peptidase (beta-lactamase class C family)
MTGGDRAELLRQAMAIEPDAPLGSRFRYASHTFDLLAEAVERATGRPFEQVLCDEVLDPLGMTETMFEPGGELAPRMAPVVIGGWEDGRRVGAIDIDRADALVRRYTALRMAGGGLWSTAPDLLRFGQAMLRGGELDGARVLAPPFVDLMTREVTVGGLGAAGDVLAGEHYALGWGKPSPANPASPSAFGHGGISGTRLWIDPAYDLVVVYLTGVWDMPTAPIDAAINAVYASVR